MNDENRTDLTSANSGDNRGRNIILVVLVLVVAVTLFTITILNREYEDLVVEYNEPAEGVEVTRMDTSRNSSDKLPEGFPVEIPIELTHLSESYRANYTQNGVTQFTVSFTSSRSKSEIWNEYVNFATSAGFTVNSIYTNEAHGVVQAMKDDDKLNVVIYPGGLGSYVTVNYLDQYNESSQ